MQPFQQSQGKMLGREYVRPDEEAIISEMIHELKAEVGQLYHNKEMLRQIHTKMHGLLRATFTVESYVPQYLKVGIFGESRSFPAWVRFSNAHSKPQPDRKKDIRGMAIKLMDVPGDKLISDERSADTQDFLLMTSPTFFARNIGQFRKLMKAVASGNKAAIAGYFLNPQHWGVLRRLMQSNIACRHLLEMQYWSTQPYQMGTLDQAVKYRVRPAAGNKLLYGAMNDDNYLRENLALTLAAQGVDFDFCVQLQSDPDLEPVEDPTIAWYSPWVKVATLHIPPQEFDRPAQDDFGELLSFSPWHSLPAHRPLGSFNRARKRIYHELSHYRHEKNRVELIEPEPATTVEAPWVKPEKHHQDTTG